MAYSMGPQSRKEIVTDFFRLIIEGRPKDGLRYFDSNCVQHNPYVHGGMDALLESMASVQKEQASELAHPNILLRHVLEEGDVVAVHTQILFSKTDPGNGGLRQVHIFRFGNDNRIVEYWDVTQVIQPDMPHAANAF
jgi:predicted SnoaL-like aldol condensation-catalyzing enzyme